MDKIKECPFCGETPSLIKISYNMGHEHIPGYQIACICGVHTVTKIDGYYGKNDEELKSKVLKIWNRRGIE